MRLYCTSTQEHRGRQEDPQNTRWMPRTQEDTKNTGHPIWQGMPRWCPGRQHCPAEPHECYIGGCPGGQVDVKRTPKTPGGHTDVEGLITVLCPTHYQLRNGMHILTTINVLEFIADDWQMHRLSCLWRAFWRPVCVLFFCPWHPHHQKLHLHVWGNGGHQPVV